jgi:AraC family transcriptional regulator
MEERVMVMELSDGQVRPTVARAPLLSSASMSWDGFLLEKHNLCAFDVKDRCPLDNVLCLQMNSTAEIEREIGGKTCRSRVLPGQISLFPARVPYSARGKGSGQFLLVSLAQNFLASVAAELDAPAQIELKPVFAEDDPLVRELLYSLLAQAEEACDETRLYAESLANMLAMHLIRRYSDTKISQRQGSPGLGKGQLRRVLDLVHANLGEDLSLQAMAEATGLSPFHFTRLFKRSTGLTPHEYVTRRRTEKAKELLLRNYLTVADVAIQTGFYDQSHLSRHFKKHYGTTPALFARRARERKMVL